ncbi:MAG: hypothetical protein ACLTYW_05755 [Collinsella sp.]
MIKTVIMGTGRMGSLIRTTAEGIVDAAGQPVFDIVAQIGFDLSELENAPAADVIIDFSNVVTFDAVVAYVDARARRWSRAPRHTPSRWTACASWVRTPASCTRAITPSVSQPCAIWWPGHTRAARL